VLRVLRKLACSVAISIVLVSLAYGQEKGGAGWFTFGMKVVDFGDLKQELAKRGFGKPEAKNSFLGGGGYGVIRGKVLLGGEGAGFSQDVSSDTLKATLAGGYGFFDVGYLAYSRENFRLFPFFGIGGGALALRIAERGPMPTFSEVLDNPKREVEISAGGMLFQVGLGLDYMLTLKEKEGGFIFGLRAGYILAPTKADWRMADRDVLGGPDARLTGPYICLTFGGGGTAK